MFHQNAEEGELLPQATPSLWEGFGPRTLTPGLEPRVCVSVLGAPGIRGGGDFEHDSLKGGLVLITQGPRGPIRGPS